VARKSHQNCCGMYGRIRLRSSTPGICRFTRSSSKLFGMLTPLPGSRKLRVLFGDPPIEWEKIHSLDDLKPWLNRDSFAAEVVRREVLARGRRALIIYGDQHLVRPATRAPHSIVGGIVAQLERSGTSVFTVHTETRQDLSALQPSVASWPKPSLAILRDTTLGATMTDSRYPSRLLKNYS